MENHPVPQNISSYEFRLVGDMTLKQFLQLAAGIIAAVLIIRLPILGIIKYPLAFLAFVIGFLMAFIPINGRPFSSWLTAFFKAIYSPTEFIWLPDAVTEVQAAPKVNPVPRPAPAVTIPKAVAVSIPPQNPVTTAVTMTQSVPAPAVPVKETVTTKSPPPLAVPGPSPVPSAPLPQSLSSPTPVISEVAPTFKVAGPGSSTLFTSPIQKPQVQAVNSAPVASVTSSITPPTSPNILAGIVVDSENSAMAGTTVEIVDIKTGIPARALRTNKLGQFQIAIPLPPGSYNIVVEKDGFTFKPVSVQVHGGLIPPVVIQEQKT